MPVDHAMRPLRRFAGWLGLLYAAILGEGLAHALTRGSGWRRHLWYCLLPPLRMGGRDHLDGGSIWLPHIGWSRVDRHLQRRLEKAFSGPMILDRPGRAALVRLGLALAQRGRGRRAG